MKKGQQQAAKTQEPPKKVNAFDPKHYAKLGVTED